MSLLTEQIVLGRNQVLTLDGAALEGVREVDVEIDTTSIDVTPWYGSWRSHLPVLGDASLRILVYWKSTWESIAPKIQQHPPVPVTLSVSNAFSWKVLVSGVRVQQPIAGVVAWEVTFKPYWY